MKNPDNLQTDKNSFFAGQFSQFLDQEARLHIRDKFLSGQSTHESKDLAHSLAAMIRKDPMNFTASLFNGNHYDQSANAKSRFIDIAVKTLPPFTSIKGNYSGQNHKQLDSQVNWDFSASVNSKIAALVTDYLMNRESQEVNEQELERFIEKHIVEPIEQYQQMQQDVPARLIALHEVQNSLMKNVEGDFAVRYNDALSTDSMDLNSVKFIEVDAKEHGISVPNEFAQLKSGLSELQEMGLSDEAGRLSLPSTSQELQHVFDREGVDMSSPELSSQVQGHLERFKAITDKGIDLSQSSMNFHQP
ncbi:hypothetical protein [Vibrio sp. TRT 29B02]|uniref:hypothetical protein n=1 Tax=Vibrio sp. TRT 29B02 TaxID=3418508 RepID=UPI003CF2B017